MGGGGGGDMISLFEGFQFDKTDFRMMKNAMTSTNIRQHTQNLGSFGTRRRLQTVLFF